MALARNIKKSYKHEKLHYVMWAVYVYDTITRLKRQQWVVGLAKALLALFSKFGIGVVLD